MLAFSILELGQNLDVLKKCYFKINFVYLKKKFNSRLKDEVDSTIGSKQHITSEDLNKLKYLESVIKETLRKWSITPLINRQSNIPFKIYDYDIPVGSEIQVNVFS